MEAPRVLCVPVQACFPWVCQILLVLVEDGWHIAHATIFLMGILIPVWGDPVWVVVSSTQRITLSPVETDVIMESHASVVGNGGCGVLKAFSPALLALVTASVALQAHHSSISSFFAWLSWLVEWDIVFSLWQHKVKIQGYPWLLMLVS